MKDNIVLGSMASAIDGNIQRTVKKNLSEYHRGVNGEYVNGYFSYSIIFIKKGKNFERQAGIIIHNFSDGNEFIRIWDNV